MTIPQWFGAFRPEVAAGHVSGRAGELFEEACRLALAYGDQASANAAFAESAVLYDQAAEAWPPRRGEWTKRAADARKSIRS